MTPRQRAEEVSRRMTEIADLAQGPEDHARRMLEMLTQELGAARGGAAHDQVVDAADHALLAVAEALGQGRAQWARELVGLSIEPLTAEEGE